MKLSIYSAFILFILFSTYTACKKTDSNINNNNAAKPTFTEIQEKILTPSCAISGCHASTSDASYAQHGLVLTADVAYNNLINKLSKNADAASLGFNLVKPFDADNSFLYHKITCSHQHHSGNFGAHMPIGGNSLTNGQVELIKRWINTGASKTDASVDLSVLSDVTICKEPVIEPLAPPAAGQGFQMKIDPFDVQQNFEREVFVRKNTLNTEVAYVNRIEMRGAPNSHHFVVYAFRNNNSLPTTDVLRDLRYPNGNLNTTTLSEMQNHIFVGGGTDVNSDFTLPAGVAIRVPTNTPLDLNAHYFNKTAATLTGENYVNFYTVPASSVQYYAKTLDLNNTGIDINPGERKTFTKTFTFNTLTRIVMLTSHYHKLGEKFEIKISGGASDGEIVYSSTDWEHPLVKSFTPPIELQPGEGLTSVVTYFNNTNKKVGFGLTSEDEMNIIFGYYY